jgi:hypothetical protein
MITIGILRLSFAAADHCEPTIAPAAWRGNRPGHLDLAYGDSPRERLDLFLTADPNAPTLAWRISATLLIRRILFSRIRACMLSICSGVMAASRGRQIKITAPADNRSKWSGVFWATRDQYGFWLKRLSRKIRCASN